MIPCPTHPDIALREERPRDGSWSGFCSRCLKNYDLCREVEYMDICQKVLNHDGPHLKRDGRPFVNMTLGLADYSGSLEKNPDGVGWRTKPGVIQEGAAVFNPRALKS